MATKPQNCGTCKHSRWAALTPTGRIARDSCGTCVVEKPVVNLPTCVTRTRNFSWAMEATGIFAEEGTDCPLYELNEGKAVSRR